MPISGASTCAHLGAREDWLADFAARCARAYVHAYEPVAPTHCADLPVFSRITRMCVRVRASEMRDMAHSRARVAHSVQFLNRSAHMLIR